MPAGFWGDALSVSYSVSPFLSGSGDHRKSAYHLAGVLLPGKEREGTAGRAGTDSFPEVLAPAPARREREFTKDAIFLSFTGKRLLSHHTVTVTLVRVGCQIMKHISTTCHAAIHTPRPLAP